MNASSLIDVGGGGGGRKSSSTPQDDVINPVMCQEIDWFRGEALSRLSSENGFGSK